MLAMPITGSVAILNPFDQRGCAWDIAKDAVDSATSINLRASLSPVVTTNHSLSFLTVPGSCLPESCEPSPPKHLGKWTLRDCLLACESPTSCAPSWNSIRARRGLLRRSSIPTDLQNILSTLQSRLIPLEPIASAWSYAKQKISWSSGPNRSKSWCLDRMIHATRRCSPSIAARATDCRTPSFQSESLWQNLSSS